MASSEKITLEEIRTPEAMRQALALRRQVFVVEQGIPEALERDGQDAEARHVLAWCDGVPVATGRLTGTPAEGIGVLARIAVLPAYRGRGLGRRIILHLEALARQEGFARVRLEPHRHLEAFYARLGYETVPGSPSTAGVHPLITMTKTLG